MNMVLIMLLEYLPIRNPCLLIHDGVINKYFVDLAPEITEEEKNRWNHMIADKNHPFSLQFYQEMVLFPDDPDPLLLPCPPDVKSESTATLILPVIFRPNIHPLCILSLNVMEQNAIGQICKLIRSVTDLLAVSMIARGFHSEPPVTVTPEEEVIPKVLGTIVGKSEKMKQLANVVRKVSSSKANILIYGESGTGKELLARAIHDNGFHRKAPFIGVNCAALTDNLLESELFGHEKGAFTGAIQTRKGRFEMADGGTLFLDEIGDTSMSFQAKILRVLQEGEFERLGGNHTIHVDVRIVCATNVNLENAVQNNQFREDLYYRLNVIKMEIPALRHRREDIPFLVRYFLEKLNKSTQKNIQIKHQDMEYLRNMEWPGNVRELENAIHSAFLMEHNKTLQFDSFTSLSNQRKDLPLSVPDQNQYPLKNNIDDIASEEITIIEETLIKTGGVQKKAAEVLGISIRQLRYRIKKYQIPVRKIHI